MDSPQATKISQQVSPESVAADVIASADQLLDHAQRIVTQIANRLAPVMFDATPAATEIGKVDKRQYPDYFDSLRSRFDSIEYNLAIIEDMVERIAV